MIVISAFTISACSKSEPVSEQTLIGLWECDPAASDPAPGGPAFNPTIEFRSDHTLTITAIEGITTLQYKLVNENTLNITDSQGNSADLPLKLSSNQFVMIARGYRVVYNRIAGAIVTPTTRGDVPTTQTEAADTKSNREAIIGKWLVKVFDGQLLNDENATFTFYPDGTMKTRPKGREISGSYNFIDETHINTKIGGSSVILQLSLVGDRMTLTATDGKVMELERINSATSGG